MVKTEIREGTEYAMREKRTTGAPFQHVQIIAHVRGNKWKARWLDPNPGLVDYVESGQLIVPWKERKAYLKEEADSARLEEYNHTHGYSGETPLTRALEQVFQSVGDGVSFDRGVLRGAPDAIDRTRTRAKLATGTTSPAGYVNRQGDLRLPYDEALELGRKFCMAEPAPVLVSIEATEREWERTARNPGGEYIVELLNEYRASWALIRQWTGYDAAVAQREAEIQRLERLVWDAIYALQKAKLDSEAARLRRAIERH